jgi:hypothetical protein
MSLIRILGNKIPQEKNYMWAQIIFISFGVVGGVSIQLNRLMDYDSYNNLSAALANIAFFAIIFTTLLWLIRRIIRKIVIRSGFPDSVKKGFRKYDTFTYGIFLLPVLGAIGVQFTFYLVALVVISFFSLQFSLLYFLMSKEHRHKISTSPHYISFLFLISGFAALIYQIVWQRSLFIAFGVNIESVTIIVSIFMFGLGTGSVMGGVLSRKYSSFLPQLFLLCEILIGLFGIASLYLINIVSEATLNSSIFTVSLSVYALLCIPTMMMGGDSSYSCCVSAKTYEKHWGISWHALLFQYGRLCFSMLYNSIFAFCPFWTADSGVCGSLF